MNKNQIASKAEAEIRAALAGEPNIALTLEAIEDDIDLIRSSLIKQDSINGRLDKSYEQTLRDQVLNTQGIVDRHDFYLSDKTKHIRIPALAQLADEPQVSYVGPPRMSKSLKVYFDSSYREHKYQLWNSNPSLPYAYIDMDSTEGDMHDLYVFNAEKLKRITVKGIFDSPMVLPGAIEDHYPVSGVVIDRIIQAIVTKYVEHYKNANATIFNNYWKK